jgi:hypothetical protein
MAHNATQITNIIARLKKDNEDFVRCSGLGYCANASIVLKEELKKVGIEGKLLYGKYLSDNAAGHAAKAHFKKLVENFPVGKDFHGRVKKHFVKNGNKLSDKGGHVGVLVDDTVYDVTSAQFGLPIAYSLSRFLGMWDLVQVVDITLKPSNTSWNQKIQFEYHNKKKEVAMEGIVNSLGADVQNEDSEYTDFMNWFTAQSADVQQHSKIVSDSELGQNYMLHIDKTTPVKFVPMMPKSAGINECNTTARITVAPTLVGCIIGYARVEKDFLEGTSKAAIERTGFRGGYEICELSFKYCLSVDDTLVFDAQRSDEHWLVNYNKDTVDYLPIKVGKLFVSRISYESVVDSKPCVDIEIYIEVMKEDGFALSPGKYLPKGYYKVNIYFDRQDHKGSVDDEKCFKIVDITPVEYSTAKKLNAALLSYETPRPKYMRW